MYRKYLTLVVFAALLSLLIPQTVLATAGQWSANGSNIYYNDGNVGLGTTTPSTKLTIVGPSATQNTLLMRIGNVDNRAWDIVGGKYGHSSYGDYSLVISQPTYSGCESCKGDLVLYPGRNTLIGGNVGIGTENPGAYKLAVNGTIRAKEIVVDTGWADYVFDNNYSLKSLAEVEEFVNTNGHLPGASSAEEIKNNGLSVSEMQTKQMKKIEELTLYLIQMNKRIENLEKENSELKAKLN